MERALVSVDVYGDFALFTNPQFKLDRMTYDVMTPSAARGVLNAIYSKPVEFFYEIKSIEVMRPIRHIDIKKNELKDGRIKSAKRSMFRDDDNTQRSNRYLRDVYYRITAYINTQEGFKGSVEALKDQFNRRVEKGKCFYQPFLGTKECTAFFQSPDEDEQPIHVDKDFGIMLYDVFNIHNNKPLNGNNSEEVLNIAFYDAVMRNGVIEVPSFKEIKERSKSYA